MKNKINQLNHLRFFSKADKGLIGNAIIVATDGISPFIPELTTKAVVQSVQKKSELITEI